MVKRKERGNVIKASGTKLIINLLRARKYIVVLKKCYYEHVQLELIIKFFFLGIPLA